MLYSDCIGVSPDFTAGTPPFIVTLVGLVDVPVIPCEVLLIIPVSSMLID